MDISNESILLDGLRQLDSQTIARIYDLYFPEIYRYSMYRLGDETISEDIASEVFVRLLEAVEAKRGPRSNLKGWLISTAAHAVSDHLRRRYRRPVEPITDTIPEPGPGVQDAYDQREQLQTVRQAYSQLTSVQQNVLALRFGQGYNLEETAAILQKNTNAIKALQFRALTALQREIGEVSHEEY